MWNLYFVMKSHANHYVIIVTVILLSSSLWNSDAFRVFHYGTKISRPYNHDNPIFFKSRCSFENPRSFKRTIVYGSLENEIKEDMTSPVSTNSNRNENDDIPMNKKEQTSIGIEFWLDLRDTAILPSAALSHLLETLDGDTLLNDNDDKVFFIDKVLTTTTNEDYTKNVKSFVDWVTQHMEEQFENLIEIIYETKKKEDSSTISIFSATSETSTNDESFGIRVDLFQDDKSQLTDPIPALQCVSQGKWVIIQPNDDNNDNNEQQRKIALDSLVELLVASTSSLSSLVLNDDNDSKGATNNVDMGGVAIACQSKSDIIHTGSIIQSLLGNGSSITCTDSGIYIPSDNNDQSSPTLLKFAIVLPMDVMLWKTAFFIFGKTEEEDEEE